MLVLVALCGCATRNDDTANFSSSCTSDDQCDGPLTCSASNPEFPNSRSCGESCRSDNDCNGLADASGNVWSKCNTCDPNPAFWRCFYRDVECDSEPDRCVAAGNQCGGEDACCPGSLCTNYQNLGVYCGAVCQSGSDCASGCCTPLQGSSSRVCAPESFCGPPPPTCPSGCMQGSVCCGGAFCGGDCIGTPCC